MRLVVAKSVGPALRGLVYVQVQRAAVLHASQARRVVEVVGVWPDARGLCPLGQAREYVAAGAQGRHHACERNGRRVVR
ncbi:hypothetical protein [Xanthomonas arboricola]|uniref:hypothetical protein n=1 Tax=Xanthomonas arboricola TaxID=56448 RepID=UPI0015E3D9D1|nr:hypothetical protein [Xanthomonas arboricola]